MKIVLIPYDKVLHLCVGFIISVIVVLIFGCDYLLSHLIWIAPLVIGIAWEVRGYINQTGTTEILDVVATVIPGVILYFIIYYNVFDVCYMLNDIRVIKLQ